MIQPNKKYNRLELQKYDKFDTPILIYHHILGENSRECLSGSSISVTRFESQLQLLQKNEYVCLPLHELFLPYSSDPHPLKSFVLTFDDGYEDFYSYAYPLLRRYDFTATIFLVVNCLDGSSHWEGSSGHKMLTWEKVKELHENGISFASHTYTHPNLLELSYDKIWHEFTTSKDIIESKLGSKMHYLSYPCGESNPEIRRLAEQAGYEAAFGVITGKRGLFNLWRIPIKSRDSLRMYSFKLTNWFDYSLRTRRWVREETAIGQLLRKLKYRLFHYNS